MPTADELSKRRRAIYTYILKHQPVQKSQLVQHFKANGSTMSAHLHTLKTMGLIFASGIGGRDVTWSAVPPPPKEPPPPKAETVAIEQVSSIWHWAERHARAR